MSNTLQSLQDAAVVLAQNGTLKDRLEQAWLMHLERLDAAQLPEDYRTEFRAMSEAMRRERPLPRENPVRASIRKMSNEEAGRYATLVVRLYAEVARNHTPVAAPMRPPVLAPIVQLFAADA